MEAHKLSQITRLRRATIEDAARHATFIRTVCSYLASIGAYFCMIHDTCESSRRIIYLTIYDKTGHYDNVVIVVIVVIVVTINSTTSYDILRHLRQLRHSTTITYLITTLGLK
jgi:hypothetical protein